MRMLAFALLPAAALLAATPALAATKAQKMETCKFGADNDHLEGAKRTAFINKCMGKGDYEPAARRDAMKKTGKKKKVMAKPAAAKPMAPPAQSSAPKQ